jgi:hypothetical protein
MIVAVAALVVALSGTAAAGDVARFAKNQLVSGDKTIKQKSLSGNRLRPRSVPGNRLRRDSLTSDEIAESRLRKVPLAARAEIATTAQEAATARAAGTAERLEDADVVQVSYHGPAGSPEQTIASTGGLVLTGACPAGQLDLTATTSADNSSIAATGTDTRAPVAVGGADDVDFDRDESFDLDQAFGDGSGDEALGRLVYAGEADALVTGELWVDERPGAGCTVVGTLVARTP